MVSIGTPYTTSGVHPPAFMWICIFYRDPSLDIWSQIGLVWDINRKDIYVICNTCNTSECVWHIMCSFWTATLRTCIVWSVISVHCKTIHRLTNALFGGLPSFNPSRKLQAGASRKQQAEVLQIYLPCLACLIH